MLLHFKRHHTAQQAPTAEAVIGSARAFVSCVGSLARHDFRNRLQLGTAAFRSGGNAASVIVPRRRSMASEGAIILLIRRYVRL